MDNKFWELTVQEFRQTLQNKEVCLIDIRTKEEWEQFWVIPWTNKYIVFWHPLFEYQIEKLDKNKMYLIYCWHWSRTKSAVDIMKNKWLISVKDLAGWIDEWIKAGEKIVEKI